MTTGLTDVPELEWEAPAPGSWGRDETHWPTPIPASYAETFNPGVIPGYQSFSSRYGLLMDHFETAYVNGFAYVRIRAVGEPEKGGGPPPAPVMWLLARLHPSLRARARSAETALEGRLWMEDLERWRREGRPGAVAANRRLQQVDLSELDDDHLGGHLQRCRENLEAMHRLHHEFNGPAMVPVGLLMELLDEAGGLGDRGSDVVVGASPLSSGRSPELERLARAIRQNAEFASLVNDEIESTAALQRLESAPGEVGAAYAEYRDFAGYRLVGHSIDHGNPTFLEVPGLFWDTIRKAVENDSSTTQPEPVEAIAELRDAVPAGRREEYDRLVSEARACHEVRDERCLKADVWAAGIYRQAILAAGRRLVRRGWLSEADDLVEASLAEMQRLLDGGGPTAEELAARKRFRVERADIPTPRVLGDEPSPPPDMTVLPEPARRMNAALFSQIRRQIPELVAPSSIEQSTTDGEVIVGVAASPGSYRGTARLVADPGSFDRIQSGDVLVAPTTSEAFNVTLPLLGAIVTDRGGILSHPAIVSRESGIPCVVGCGDATERIPDGAMVEVDGGGGEVRVIG